MEYKLTQEDIDFLNQQGISSAFDAEPNMVATESEMAALGIEPDVNADALPDPVAAAPAEIATQQAADFAPAQTTAAPIVQTTIPAVDTPDSGFLSSMGDTLFGPKEAGDQFANLNRQQRMMLAFGAVKDAGFALQGKESNSFSSTLKAINDQMDMGRKAKAAQAQQQMLQGLMGGGAAGGDLDAQRQQAMKLLLNPATVEYGKSLLAALDALEQKGSSDELRGRSAVSTLRDIDSIIDMIDQDPNMTTGVWAWATRGIAMTPAGKTQLLVDSVVSSLALDSLKALKATGATMGALNQSELEILKTELAKVDLSAGAEEAKIQLGKVQGHYRTVISDLYRGANDEDAAKITMFLGLPDRPSWAGGSSSSNAPPTDADLDRLYPPTQP